MSQEKNFFKEAIADAKVIKETAFNNAKIALTESFAPKIKSMLSSQLNEIDEETEQTQDEMSLDELLNELEDENTSSDDLNEEPQVNSAAAGAAELEKMVRAAVAKTPEVAKKIAAFLKGLPAGAGAALRSENTDDSLNEVEDDDEVGEITVDELKDIIRDVMGELESNEETEEIVSLEDDEIESSEEDEISIDDEVSDEDEINLDEILSEEPQVNSAAAGAAELEKMVRAAVAKTPEVAKKIAAFLKGLPAGAGAALRSESSELQEMRKKLNNSQKTLNEVNLLNAKLLFVNKIFKSKNLQESQKIKVINALDRAKTVNEAKNTYNVLKESMNNVPRKPLHENLGRASRSSGMGLRNETPRLIKEDVDFISRMQHLAGIK